MNYHVIVVERRKPRAEKREVHTCDIEAETMIEAEVTAKKMYPRALEIWTGIPLVEQSGQSDFRS